MAENDVRVATARREKRVPSIEQITRVIHSYALRNGHREA